MEKQSGIKIFLSSRRFRLYFSVALAIVVFFVSQSKASTTLSFMYSWLSFAFFQLVASWIIILSYHPKEVKAFAKKEDTSGPFIFLFVLLAALISLIAIIVLLQAVPNESKRGLSIHILLSFSSVFCSWTLVHTLFTLRYAHLYYQGGEDATVYKEADALGLDFPNEKEPDYLDFAYFAFVVGMTFQVSDVEINSRQIRRLALLHGFLSFIYNTVIVAFSINIVSSLISK